MERVEQLMQLKEGASEDIMLRDFVNKRGMLMNETMRVLAKQCTTLCNQY